MTVAILGIDYKVALWQELVCNHNRLIKEAARVATQVKNKLGHTLASECSQSLHQLDVRGAGKLRQTHKADVAANHKCRLDALDWNCITHHIYIHQFIHTLTLERELHLCTTLTAQTLHDVVLWHLNARHQSIVHLDDAVTRHNTRLGTWAIWDDAQDDNRIGSGIEHHANTIELALQRFVHSLHIACGDVFRVGIKLLHHQRDDQLGERVHRDGINKLVLHQHTGLHQLVWRGQARTADECTQLCLRLVATHKLTQQNA